MQANQNKNRIKELEKLITKYQNSYYNGEAEISDGEFDLLWDELKSLAPDSEILKKVGTGYDVDGFPKARHIIPMGSQDKASNPNDFLSWFNNLLTSENEGLTPQQKKTLIVQYKLDGASLELQYEKGKLIKAVTRGDGITGDDITSNALKMNGIIPKIKSTFSGGIRGEVIMTHEIWESKYSEKANCRNAANGLMRRKDGQGCEDLTYIAFDASAPEDDEYFKDEIQKINWLKTSGFNTTETKIFTDANEIIKYREQVSTLRDELPFDIDGLVVKDIEIDMADLRKARPEKQIAFKFDLETAFSILREVIWSESGATYTPIAVIDPVRLAGTTVKRANLNNPGLIRSMNLKIGSAVSVVKRGEIIPKIEGLAPILSTEAETEIIIPDKCGVCNTALTDLGTRLYCPNPQCSKRLLHRLEKWVTVLDIRELGDKLLKQLFDKKRVRYIHELYTLSAEELSEYDRMGELSAAKVIRHIQTKHELSLGAFIAGFNLENIAETTMDKITAAGFDTLEKLRGATVEQLSAIFNIGEITSSVIVDGLIECTQEMDAVLKQGIITIAAPKSQETQPLYGLSFCFTGELKSMKRTKAEEKIKALGAMVKSSITKDLSYLVTNDPASGSEKNQKAKKLGIPVIGEDEFLTLISEQKKQSAPIQNELF